MSQGDIDGDGLIDFVYYEADRTWINVARNNGDGTFAIALSDDIGVKTPRQRMMMTNSPSRYMI